MITFFAFPIGPKSKILLIVVSLHGFCRKALLDHPLSSLLSSLPGLSDSTASGLSGLIQLHQKDCSFSTGLKLCFDGGNVERLRRHHVTPCVVKYLSLTMEPLLLHATFDMHIAQKGLPCHFPDHRIVFPCITPTSRVEADDWCTMRCRQIFWWLDRLVINHVPFFTFEPDCYSVVFRGDRHDGMAGGGLARPSVAVRLWRSPVAVEFTSVPTLLGVGRRVSS